MIIIYLVVGQKSIHYYSSSVKIDTCKGTHACIYNNYKIRSFVFTFQKWKKKNIKLIIQKIIEKENRFEFSLYT